MNDESCGFKLMCTSTVAFCLSRYEHRPTLIGLFAHGLATGPNLGGTSDAHGSIAQQEQPSDANSFSTKFGADDSTVKVVLQVRRSHTCAPLLAMGKRAVLL